MKAKTTTFSKLRTSELVPEVLESWYEICIGSPTKNLEHEFFITEPKTEQ